MIDVTDPLNPVFAGCYQDDGYTHDAQCVIYRGPDVDYHNKEVRKNVHYFNNVHIYMSFLLTLCY